jgi:hypothetical protein
MMLGAPHVELERRGNVIMPHHTLNHVGWYLVVDQPRGV